MVAFGLFLDFLFGFGSPVPMSQNEAAFFNLFLEFLVAVHAGDAAVTVIERRYFFVDI